MSSALNRRNWFFEKSCETEFQTVRIGFNSIKQFVQSKEKAKMFVFVLLNKIELNNIIFLVLY